MIGKKINQLATELAPVSTDLTIIGDPTTGVSKKITLAQLGAIFSGAVSFYTNLAGFPATGDINVIYCAKDTQKLYLWSGSAYVEVFPSQALLDTYQLRSEKGVSNGYASLDSSGKVPISQLPSSIMEYKGTWNAATNTPTLANGTGDTGDVYICNVAGTVNFGAGPITFAVGDYVIYSGSIWQRSSGAVGTVTSVAVSRSGDALTITGSPITTSGTINIGFAGTGTQYIKGDGTLATFPSIISQAQNLITEVYNNTGATLTKGTIVYINGGQGNLPTVAKALATGDSTSAQTFGVVQADITNMNNGYVVVAGRISDLDTQAYSNGTQLYLSPTTAGTWTSTKPYAPQHLVYVGIVVRAHPTQGVVEIKIQNGYEMDELHNVSAQSPDNNDILQYKTSTSLWTKVAGTTSNIAEGSNLYYTDARSRAALSFTAGSGAYNSTTGVITIPTNTNQLTNGAAYITLGSLSAGAGISYNNTTGVIASTITQYTDALARASISLNTTGTSGAATYNSTTGVLNVPQYAPDLSGYVPTSRTLTINGTAYDLSANRSWSVGTVTSVGLSSATSGVTIGSTPVTSSGTITLAIATASGSQQGLLSSTDWTTFNNKQSALTNPVTGTGTTNYLPKFTGTSTIGNSAVQDDGTSITILSRIVGINGASEAGWGLKAYENLKVQNNNGTTILQLADTASGGKTWSLISSGTGNVHSVPNGTFYLRNSSDGLTALQVNASGNLGLGVTPSAWDTNTNVRVLQMNAGSLWGFSTTAFLLVQNSFSNTSGVRTYVNNGFASEYEQASGQHIWKTAPSGTAGNAISFTQAMTLNASGNLSIGNTNDTYKLDVSGTGMFRNSDGSDLIRYTATGVNTEYATKIVSGANDVLVFRRQHSTAGALDIMALGFNGNVGIGTTSPSGRLMLYQSTAGNVFQNIVSNQGGSTQVGINLSPSMTDGEVAANPAQASIYATDSNYGANIIFANKTTGAVGNSLTERMRITSGGLVGIGTTDITTVGSRLVVAQSDTPNILTIRSTNASNTGAGRLFFQTTNASSTTVNSAFIEAGLENTTTNSYLAFASNTTERMRITSGGNVGIGTSSPNLTATNRTVLDVNGTSTSLIALSTGGTAKGYIFHGGTNMAIANYTNGGELQFNTNDGSDNTRMRITSGGAVEMTGTIKTASPSSGSAQPWKLGSYAAGGTGTATGVIYIEVNGQVYSIPALLGTP